MKKILLLLVVLIVAGVAFWLLKNTAIAPQNTSATPAPSVSSSPANEANIIITSPQANTSVSSPITVTGKARVFENAFSYRLKGANGAVLYEGFAMSDAPDIGRFGDFTVKIPIPATATINLTIEVFSHSAKDGSIINLVSVPVKLQAIEKSKVKIYLSNGENTDCTKTTAFDREILKTNEPAFAALSELIKGEAPGEEKVGYFGALPKDTQVNSISITNGTAKVDFNHVLEAEVGGSCRILAIRAQITNTLKQFPTVKNVVISVNGRTEDILQP